MLSLRTYVPIALGLVMLATGCTDSASTTQPAGGMPATMVASTRSTGWVPLSGSVVTGVDVNCTLTIQADGTMTESCKFRNNQGVAKKFVFCDMIDLLDDLKGPTTTDPNAPRAALEKNGTTLECTPLSSNLATVSSYHFGCAEVDLPANGTFTITTTGPTKYVPWDGVPRGAWDFQVNYADIASLEEMATSYDAASCEGVKGQAGWLVPFAPNSAAWVVYRAPFDDPFVAVQLLAEGEIASVDYVPFAGMPCVPAAADIANPPYEPCSPEDLPAPATKIELNLFWFESRMVEEGAAGTLPLLVQRPIVQGDLTGIRVIAIDEERELDLFETDEPIDVPLGEEPVAVLQFCAEDVRDRCLAPDVEEGRNLVYVVPFVAVESGFEFPQTGQITKDTVPPVVIDHDVQAADGALTVSVTVADETTTPAHAEIWVTGDGGETWTVTVLAPEVALVDDAEARERTFVGEAPGSAGAEYYFVVQDQVFNTTYTSTATAG